MTDLAAENAALRAEQKDTSMTAQEYVVTVYPSAFCSWYQGVAKIYRVIRGSAMGQHLNTHVSLSATCLTEDEAWTDAEKKLREKENRVEPVDRDQWRLDRRE